MVFGIIAEGKGDCAVLENILWNIIDDDDELRFLRPEFGVDENDLQNKEKSATMDADQFSSWTLVRKDCIEQDKFRRFLSEAITKEDRRVILQIDTAECDQYGVQRPNKKAATYCTDLRQAVIQQLQTWLNGQYEGLLYYAICIEETEAWLLPLYENKPSYTSAKPKEKLLKLLHKQGETAPTHYNEYEKMSFYSKPLRKAKDLKKARKNNPSLEAFLQELEADLN